VTAKFLLPPTHILLIIVSPLNNGAHLCPPDFSYIGCYDWAHSLESQAFFLTLITGHRFGFFQKSFLLMAFLA
jgi:hypothetical protein